jgi:hypothetical protein
MRGDQGGVHVEHQPATVSGARAIPSSMAAVRAGPEPPARSARPRAPGRQRLTHPDRPPRPAASREIADCDAKLRQHRAALEAGADPAIGAFGP